MRADRRGRSTAPSSAVHSVHAVPLALIGALFGGLLASAVSAEAAPIHVPRTHRTIQAGIEAASPGDTVFVGPGTYSGTITMRKGPAPAPAAGGRR